MKKLLILAVFGLILLVSKVEADTWGGGVSFNYFYTTLSPYGEWVEVDNGIYAWHPYDVPGNWKPYSVGRWIWSEYGWYWDSFEPFGWAVYHYGRWYNDDYYGWIWIPDYDWGPSWVEWRYNDDYVGWAPLPPYAIYRPGVGIHFTLDWHFPVAYWNYVECDHFYDYEIHRYLLPEKVKYRVFSETRYRTNYDYRNGHVINRGIDRQIVERRSGRPVVERNIVETTRLRDFEGSRSSRGERVQVFRPNQQEVNRVREIPDMNIKRTDRRTSLDVSKIERNTERTVRTPDINIRKDNNERKVEQYNREDRRINGKATQENPNNQRSNPGIERKSREEPRVIEQRNNNTEQRRERPVIQNPQQNERQPQVRERRTEERRQEAPQENRREERQNNGSSRERRR